MAPHPPDTPARSDRPATEADIMAVDFSDEIIIFKKMNILAHSGAFALSQTNTLAPTVLALLRGGPDHN